MIVRDARPDDVEALAALKPGPALHEDRLQDASSGGIRYLVAEEDGDVVAFGVLVLDPPASWPPVHPLPQALDLFVRADRRSRGIGRRLLEVMEGHVQAGGGTVLYLCVASEANPRARALYRRCGYEPLDERPVREAWSFVDSAGVRHASVDWIQRLGKSLGAGGASLAMHSVTLQHEDLVLRPLAEEDWPHLEAWHQDPRVLRFAETDRIASRSSDDVKALYRWVSKQAFTFLMEAGGRPIGECWLQRMNLPRILESYPATADLRRIDMMIGDLDAWGGGYGTRASRLLLALAFETQRADAVFGCDVWDENIRSRRMLARLGFVRRSTFASPKGSAGDYVLTREAWRDDSA